MFTMHTLHRAPLDGRLGFLSEWRFLVASRASKLLHCNECATSEASFLAVVACPLRPPPTPSLLPNPTLVISWRWRALANSATTWPVYD